MGESWSDVRPEDLMGHESDRVGTGWAYLSDLAEVNPRSPSPSDGEAVSFVAMADVSESGVIDNFELREASAGYTPFAVGDVLVAKITPCFENGKGAHVRGLPTHCGQGSTEFHVLRPRSTTSDRYLYHLTRTSQFRLQGEGLMSGSAGQRRVPTEFFGRYIVRMPPLEEQRRITEILDTIDETIQATERVIAKLKEVRRGLLLDVLDTYFSGSGPLVLRSNRSKADCVVLSALLESGEIELGRGKVISAIDIADDPGPYPIYSSSASATGEFGSYDKFMFDEELITWSVDGGGRPFYRPRHRFSVTNVGGYLRIRARHQWSYRYVHALMEVQHAHLTFDWLTKAHPSVIRDLYRFPRIPLSEQHQITECLAATETSVRRLEEETLKLNCLRSGLAADLLSGRVRTMTS